MPTSLLSPNYNGGRKASSAVNSGACSGHLSLRARGECPGLLRAANMRTRILQPLDKRRKRRRRSLLQTQNPQSLKTPKLCDLLPSNIMISNLVLIK